MKHSFIISSLAALLALGLVTSAQAANTENDYSGTSTALGTGGNWSLGHVATVSEDANFNGFTGIAAATVTNTTMNWGSLNLTTGSKTITIGNSSTAGDSSLTLGGVGSTGDSVAGSASVDLIYVASGNTLNIQNTVGSGTKLLNLVLGQSGNFDIVGTATVSSAISDGGSAYGITKTGAGTLTLTGANTYTGATTVNVGALTLGSGGLLSSSSTLAVGGVGTFNFSGAAAATQTVNGLNANVGMGTVNNTVSGTTLNLGAATHSAGGMVYFGNTTGTIASTTNTSGIIGPWAFLGSGPTLDYAVANGTGVAISSLGAATTLPSGGPGVSTTNYTLAGAQTQTANTVGNTLRYTGNAQSLALGSTSLGLSGLMNAGTGLLTITGTALNPGLVTTGELDIVSNTGGITISSVISGSGSLAVGGVGTTVAVSATSATGLVTLSGVNTYNGGTVIDSGALRASNNSALGTAAVTVANGAQLQLNGAVSINNTININGSSALFSVTGSGTPNLTGIVNLQSNSSISLANNSGNAAMTLSGTLNLNGNVLTANTISVNPAITLSAVVNGSGGIAEGGNGVLVITNDNSATYSGTTTIASNGATLEVGSDGALGSGTLSLNATSATLTVRSADATNHTLSNALVLGGNSSTTYNFGAATTFTGNLTFTNATAIALSSVRTFNVLNAQTQFNAGFFGAAGGITKTGAGALILTSASTNSGATTVSAGTLVATNTTGSATGGGALAVNAGATLAGTGITSGSSFNVSGSSSVRANVLVGQTSTLDTNTTSNLTMIGSGASTIAAANLTFNLNSAVAGGLGTDPATSGNELLVGATAITFNKVGSLNTTLTLNLQGNSIIAANTPYVLIAGTAVGSSAATSQYSGLSFGTSSGTLSSGLITPILNSGYNGTGNLSLNLLAGAAGYYGANSYLFLYQNTNTGVDDIEVEVVPEPSTWAMMLGGLVVLVFIQRRKSKLG
jgi:fibronectin-binding autotransporter adhesin